MRVRNQKQGSEVQGRASDVGRITYNRVEQAEAMTSKDRSVRWSSKKWTREGEESIAG